MRCYCLTPGRKTVVFQGRSAWPPILASLTDIYAKLYENDSPPYAEQERTLLGYVRSLGTFDPRVITEGTLAYGLVFPSGFKAVLIGSAGPGVPL